MPKSKFVDIFGEQPHERMMDFLLENPKRGYTLTEIIDETKVDHPVAYSFMHRLVCKCYAIEENSKYRLDLENSVIKQFLELKWENNHSGSCEE